MAYEIDLEIRRIMGEALDEAYKIIEAHREQLNIIAEKLLEVETLDARQIKSLFETGKMPTFEEDDNNEPIEDADTFEEAKEKAEQEELADRRDDDNDDDLPPTGTSSEELSGSKVRKTLENDEPIISDKDSE